MQAKLQNRKIGERVIIAEFAVPAEFAFEAGEYTQVILGEDKPLKHYFSIASSPNEKGTVRIATRPSQSAFKTTLQSLPIGSEVVINGPWGDVLFPENNSEPLVFIAGGIGITPFLSMMRFAAEEELAQKILLLHFGDLDEFHDEVESAAKANPNFTFKHVYEHISTEILKSNLPDSDRIFYVAGPPGFVNETMNILATLKIPPARILSESYTGY